MLRLISEITVGNFKFDYVTRVNIDSSFDTFTDTARIVLPNRFRKKEKTIVAGKDNVFQKGDAVTIKIGYFPNLTTRFLGFVANVVPDSPLILECEDEMWQLKQVNLVSKEFTDPTIKDVVEYATASLPDLVIEYDDETAKIGAFHVDNKGFINAVTVFEVLKKQFGYNIYFRAGTLHVRVLVSLLALTNPTHRIGFQHNVITSNLTYQRDDDHDMMVRFESKQDDDTVLTFFGFKKKKADGSFPSDTIIDTVGKAAGVTHSWNIPKLTATQIKKIIADNIDKFVYEGYNQGSFLTFLEPVIDSTDTVEPIDNEHPEREGKYLVESVSIEFGINGGRQDVILRNKVA